MRLRRLLVLLAATPLLLAGCGSSPQPKPLPKPSGSAASSSSPSPPVMPAAAKEKTKRGAIASTRHFLEALNYAGATGDTQPFVATYNQHCTRCSAIAQGIRSTYANGGHIEGGDWIPQSFKAYDIDGRVAFVDAVVSYRAQTFVPHKGAHPVSSKERKNVLKTFELTWHEQSWQVSALDPNA